MNNLCIFILLVYPDKGPFYLAFSLLRLHKCIDNLKHVLKTLLYKVGVLF